VSGVLRAVFGAHGQLAVGASVLVVSVASWVYGATLRGEALVRFIFHVSMAALVIASYAIIAAALGYRATERVEAQVVEHADNVSIGGDR
jgi:ABC-type Na+ efflux pump permease subunit